MHKYMHHIGDFMSDTVHLTALEECFYRRALDFYYMNEKPLPKETQSVFRRLRARTQEEQDAVLNVLDDFFTEQEDGFHNKRADAEIAEYQANAVKNRENGKKGGRPPKNKPSDNQESTNSDNPKNSQETQSVILGYEDETQTKGNHQPLTKNQEPRTNNLNTHATGEEKNSLDDDLQLWQPTLKQINDWRKRAGLPETTQFEFNQTMIAFMPYYAPQIRSGRLNDNQVYSKYIAWVKRDNSKDKPISGTKQAQSSGHNPRNVNEAWGEIPDYAVVDEDTTSYGGLR